MKALVLAAGYGTRLQPLVQSLGLNIPKALLSVAGRPVIEYIFDKIIEINSVDEIIIVTNTQYHSKFEKWKRNFHRKKPRIKIITARAELNNSRGAVSSLDFAIKKEKINDNLLVVGSDNIFDFSLLEMYEFFKTKKTSVIAICDVEKKERLANRFGVVEIDKFQRIVGFEEKPKRPKTNLASLACYIFAKKDIDEVNQYLKSGGDPDNLGNFISWFISRKKVYGFVFNKPWFDIGTREDYEEACKIWNQKMKKL